MNVKNTLKQTVLTGCLLAFILIISGCSPYRGVENKAYQAVNSELTALKKNGRSALDLEADNNFFSGWVQQEELADSLPANLKKIYLNRAFHSWEIESIVSPDEMEDTAPAEAVKNKKDDNISVGTSLGKPADSSPSSDAAPADESGSQSAQTELENPVVVSVILNSADLSFLSEDAMQNRWLPWMASQAMKLAEEKPDLSSDEAQSQLESMLIEKLGTEIQQTEDQTIHLQFYCSSADGRILAIIQQEETS